MMFSYSHSKKVILFTNYYTCTKAILIAKIIVLFSITKGAYHVTVSTFFISELGSRLPFFIDKYPYQIKE